MYDPTRDASTADERYARDGETLFQHVARVHDAWKANTSRTDPLIFDRLPTELKAAVPEPYSRFSDEALGTLCALVFMYLGGRGPVNEAVVRKWFREAVAE